MRTQFGFALLVVSLGCGSNSTGNHTDGGLGPDGEIHDMGIVVTPDPANLDLNQGGPPVTQTFKAIAHVPGGAAMDVSADAAWTIDDNGMGQMIGPTFTSVITRGGTTRVHATWTPPGMTSSLSGEAILNVKFHVTVTGTTCPGCPAFPPDGTPVCTGMDTAPNLVYPPDNVLLPPNMNVIEVHFMPGTGNTLFEIDFANAATDVRVETMCNAVTNTRGSPTGGCAYQLDPTVWSFVADSNRAGDPVTVTVRGAPSDLSCVDLSNSRRISFAEEDMAGGIYYWQSVVQGGIAGKTGGIFRHDFGDPASTSEPFLTPGTTNKCVGCHFLSRDGLRMTYGSDDADSDDEYADLHVVLYDVMARMSILTGLPAGFQAFAPDHTSFLASDGVGSANPEVMKRYDGDTGTALQSVLYGMDERVTQPDWTKDGTTVYYTKVGTILTGFGAYTRHDDLHFMAGSIFSRSYDAATDMFGAPTPVIMSASMDENDYYPSVSPDGAFLVWNRAVGTDVQGHDDFNNPNARLMALKIVGGAPVDMTRANIGDGLTNSWPRWSPFIQNYKGKKLLWVTFSSTRDYGLRVENQNPPDGPLMNCYPPESPENPSGSHQMPFPPNCTQPQIWMAAVTLSDLELSGVDPSFPAFWLPFQDVTAHNHIAQWTEQVVGPPPGMCQMSGQMCSATLVCCAGLTCDSATSTCGTIIP